jgi:Flp pilus assembly protein TadG
LHTKNAFWGTELERSFLKEQGGAAMIELTLVAGLLLTLVLGFVDFGYAFYQWNAATKAVQVGARLAAVSSPVADGLPSEAASPASTSDIGAAVPADQYHYRCTANAAGVASCSCVTGTCIDVTADQDNFDLIFYGDDLGPTCGVVEAGHRAGMCDFFPRLTREYVRIDYVATGLGYWTRPGGPVPTIRVSLVKSNGTGIPFQFFFLSGLLGFGQIAMPSMLSTITGEDLSTTF